MYIQDADEQLFVTKKTLHMWPARVEYYANCFDVEIEKIISPSPANASVACNLSAGDVSAASNAIVSPAECVFDMPAPAAVASELLPAIVDNYPDPMSTSFHLKTEWNRRPSDDRLEKAVAEGLGTWVVPA